jgi:hypothetical protein
VEKRDRRYEMLHVRDGCMRGVVPPKRARRTT